MWGTEARCRVRLGGIAALLATLALASVPPARARPPFAYVNPSALSPGALGVIDLATNALEAHLDWPDLVPAVALSPDGTEVYVLSSFPGALTVLDAGSRSTLAVIQLSFSTSRLAVTEDGRRMFVAGGTKIAVIDTATRIVEATLELPRDGLFDVIKDIAPSVDGSKLYCGSGRGVWMLDVDARAFDGPTRLDGVPERIAVAPDGERLYVGTSEHDAVVVLDAAALASIAVWPLDAEVGAVSLSPDGTALYAGTAAGLKVVDVEHGSVLWLVPTPCKASSIAFTSDGALAYLTQGCEEFVLIVDTASGEAVAAVVVGGGASSIAVAPGPHVVPEPPPLGPPPAPRSPAVSREAWVVNLYGRAPDGYDFEAGEYAEGTVSIIDAATHVVRESIEVLPLPLRVVFRPDGEFAYVLCRGDPFGAGGPGLVVIDARAKAVVATLPLGYMPWDLAVSPDGRFLYVLIQYPDTDVADVQVIDTQRHAATHSISITGGEIRGRFRLSPDGSTGLVALAGNFRGEVAIVDLVAGRHVTSIFDSSYIASVHLNPGGRLAYARSRLLSVIDIEAQRGAGAFPIGHVQDLAISRDGERIYALHWSGITVIDARRGRIATTIPLPPGRTNLTAAPDGEFLYAWSSQPPAADVSALDAHGNPIATIELPFAPSTLAVAPDGHVAYAARVTRGDAGSDTVAVIDTAAHAVAGEIRGDYGPIDIAFAPEPAAGGRPGRGCGIGEGSSHTGLVPPALIAAALLAAQRRRSRTARRSG